MPKRKANSSESEAEASDAGSGSDVPVKKTKKTKVVKEKVEKPKKESSSKGKAKAKAAKGNDDTSEFISLGGTRRVTVRQFNGKTLVDIREYYEDKSSGEMKPGKKGISLSAEQWSSFKEKLADIDKLVDALE
ncbi:PC4-domain-containing protein [Clavulina sp. PMI_390]|nr:PC4-domain-containing protein [Clavulina sp. PMI_390]